MARSPTMAASFDIHPDNVTLMSRAHAYNLKDEPDRAVADCNRAIQISPEHRDRPLLPWHGLISPSIAWNSHCQFRSSHPVQSKRFPVLLFPGQRPSRPRGLRTGTVQYQASNKTAPNQSYLHRWNGIAHLQAGQLYFRKRSTILAGRTSSIRRIPIRSCGSILCDRRVVNRASFNEFPGSLTCCDGRLHRPSFLGEIDPNAVLVGGGDANVRSRQRSEFLTGESALHRGEKEEARQRFQLRTRGMPQTL